MSKRFSEFGVVVNPPNKIETNWKELNSEQVSKELSSLGFPNADEITKVLLSLTVEGAKRRNSEERYNSKITNFGGQIEIGTQNGAVHWQLWIEIKPKVTKRCLLQALSKAIYRCDLSKAISVQPSGGEFRDLKNYCVKQNNLELLPPYEQLIVDSKAAKLIDYLKENPELKKLFRNLEDFRSIS